MRFKEFLFITLSISFFLSCFPKDEKSSTSLTLPVIGVSVDLANRSVYIKSFNDALRSQGEGRARMIFKNSKNDQSIQDVSIDELLEENIDALIVFIVNSNHAESIIKKVQSRNIPVIFIIRDPGPEIIGFWDNAYFAGSFPAESGRMSTEIILSYFKDRPEADLNGDGIIQYIALTGEAGTKQAVFRTKAYADTFAYNGEKGGFFGEALAEESAMWNHEIAYEKTLMLLEKFPEKIEAILANNDGMALGALQALKENGYNLPRDLYGARISRREQKKKKYIPVVGIDASPDAVHAISQGSLLGSVYDSVHSQSLDALNMAISLAQGNDAGDELSVPLTDYSGEFGGHYAWVPQQKVLGGNYRNFLNKEINKDLG